MFNSCTSTQRCVYTFGLLTTLAGGSSAFSSGSLTFVLSILMGTASEHSSWTSSSTQPATRARLQHIWTPGHQDNQRQNSFYVTALFTLYSVWRQAAALSPGCTGIVLLSASSFLLVCTGSFIIDWLLPSTGSCWC